MPKVAAPAIRLQKFLAEAGLCSRRSAEGLIARGAVSVNGAPAALGSKVIPGLDRVAVEGKPVSHRAQPRITLAIHKPRGLVCSNDDPHNPKTIFDLLPCGLRSLRLFCAGRLDKDSEGLVILTTDGGLAHRLMHPSNAVVKRYHVVLDEPFPAARLKELVRGVTIEGERLRAEWAALVNGGVAARSTSLDLHLHHGRKREIRLLLRALGCGVRRLRRYQIGSLRLQGIPLRGGKQLSNREIEMLFHSPPAPRARHFCSAENS